MKKMRVILACLTVLLVFTATATAQNNACVPDITVELKYERPSGFSEFSHIFSVHIMVTAESTNTPQVLTGPMAAYPSEPTPCDGQVTVDEPFVVNLLTAGPIPVLLDQVEVFPPTRSPGYYDTFLLNRSRIPDVYHGSEIGIYAEADSCYGKDNFSGWCGVREYDETNNQSNVVTVFLP